MKKIKKTCCLVCGKPFETNRMADVHCSIKCRFLAFVEKDLVNPNGCWIWKGGRDKDGYGIISIENKSRRAHRVSYEIFKNEVVPYVKNVCHTCDNPSCVNPDHLYVGEPYQNTQDMINKGRARFSGSLKTLNEDIIKRIFLLHSQGFTMSEIGRVFLISRDHVQQILERKIWAHVQID